MESNQSRRYRATNDEEDQGRTSWDSQAKELKEEIGKRKKNPPKTVLFSLDIFSPVRNRLRPLGGLLRDRFWPQVPRQPLDPGLRARLGVQPAKGVGGDQGKVEGDSRE